MTKNASRLAIPKSNRVVQKLRSAIHRSPSRIKAQDVISERTFLGVAVLARDDVDDQPQFRIEDHQAMARQGRRPRGAQHGEAMLGAGEVVAVEDLGPVAIQERRPLAPPTRRSPG